MPTLVATGQGGAVRPGGTLIFVDKQAIACLPGDRCPFLSPQAEDPHLPSKGTTQKSSHRPAQTPAVLEQYRQEEWKELIFTVLTSSPTGTQGGPDG